MHCTNCGTYIAPGTRYCAGCGAPAVDPEMTRFAGAQPQPFSAPPSSLSRHITLHLRSSCASGKNERCRAGDFQERPTLFFVKIGYGLAALGAIPDDYSPGCVHLAPWWIALP